MNSTNGPSSINPTGITSFTSDNGGGNNTSLSSALAETVANLACFGGAVDAKGAGAKQNSQIANHASGNGAGAAASDGGGNMQTTVQRSVGVVNPLGVNGQSAVEKIADPIRNAAPVTQQQQPAAAAAAVTLHNDTKVASISLEMVKAYQGNPSEQPKQSIPINPLLSSHSKPREASQAISSILQRINKPSHSAPNSQRTKPQTIPRGVDSMSSTVASLQMAFATPNKRPEAANSHSSAPTHPSKKGETTRHERSLSGPVVSGTAFSAVLALQRGGSKGSPSPGDKTKSPSDSNTKGRKEKKHSADGAPIIAGTAAAAMAIATAARIATENESKTMHGFGMVHDSDLERMVRMSTKAVLGMDSSDKSVVKKTPVVKEVAGVRITPEEQGASSSCGYQIKSQTRPLHQQSVSVTASRPFRLNSTQPASVTVSSQPSYLNSSHISNSNITRCSGGMDILADIICHVPPMAVPESSVTQSLSSNPYTHHSYHPPQHANVPVIPSYQEIYQEMGLQQHPNREALTHYHSHHSQHYSVETVSRDGESASNRLPYHYGHPLSGEIEEGKELYTRKDLMVMGGHMLENRDVHGSMKEGADSIVLCNLERDIREGDGLCWFLYSCDRTNGGGALCRSYHKKRAIRVFRSSALNGKYASPYLDEDEDDEIGYRYDGLYMVGAVWDIYGNETEAFPCTGTEGWQTYFFTRLPKKPLDGRTEPGIQYNSVGLQELWGTIQKMRGVRRPKKFEIPPAPMKLPPMKMSAITGEYKDRKSASYRPPPVQEQLVEKSNDRRKPDPPIFDSSSDEEAPDSPRGSAKRSETSAHSSRDRSPKIAPRPIPNKVVTPRPRMSSTSQDLKKTLSSPSAKRMASTESDSSDSETESSAPAKRTRVDSPKLNSMSPTKRPNNLAQVISTLLPKRATAAKAEAANRDMLGKNKKKRPYNRRSAAASPRKRPRRSKRDDESSASSIDGIDPDILTVGSRVLVLYKGSLFKATIRKRREKNGKHDFQIHYDGNKKSNVHWVPADRIQKILFIALDATPDTKRPSGGKKGKRGGWNKKKAAESDSENDSDQSDDESVHEDAGEEPNQSKSENVESPESKPIDMETEPEEELDLNVQTGETATIPVRSSDKRKAPIFDDDMEEVSTVAASKDASASVGDDEIVRKDTNESIATTSTSNSRKNRVTVFDDLEVAKDMSTSPRSTRKNALLHKSSTLSSADADALSIDASATSENEEQVGFSEQEEDQDQTNDLKFPVGTRVYVEYRRIFYSSTILQTRRKRKLVEYLVHYKGYKKASDRWVKESSLHEVNAETTRRFEEQRPTPSNTGVQPEFDAPSADTSMTTRGKSNASDDQSHQHFTRQKKPPSRSRSDISANTTQLVDIEAGVAFLPGSVVFVEWSGALYLAKMVKKRFSGERTEYLLSYDGYDSDYDAWNSIHNIYEVNPKTKRVFNKMNAEIKNGSKSKRPDPPKSRQERKKRGSASSRSSSSVKTEAKPKEEKEIFTSPPLPRRRGARKKRDDDSISVSDQASKHSSAAAQPSIDMQGIPPGVEFLPGSTLFAERNGSLCLAKMLKKRGKGDFMEYFVQFNDGTDDNESMWISTALVYEINPQTKRMFRQLSKG